MIKHYGQRHWGLWIPLWRKRLVRMYSPSLETVLVGYCALHFGFTLKYDIFCGMREFRLRVGVQRL